MNLLHKSGVDCGLSMREPDRFNPSGYYESDQVYQIQYDTFEFMREFMPKIPASIPKDKCAPDKINRCYDKSLFAIKTPYAITSEIVYHPKKHIYIHRNPEDQAMSLMRVNTGEATLQEWITWIKEWQRYILDNYEFDLIIHFSEWMHAPLETYEKLYKLGLPKKLSEQEILDAINTKQPIYHT